MSIAKLVDPLVHGTFVSRGALLSDSEYQGDAPAHTESVPGRKAEGGQRSRMCHLLGRHVPRPALSLGFQQVPQVAERGFKLSPNHSDSEWLRQLDEPAGLSFDEHRDFRPTVQGLKEEATLELWNRSRRSLPPVLIGRLVLCDLPCCLKSATQHLRHVGVPRPYPEWPFRSHLRFQEPRLPLHVSVIVSHVREDLLDGAIDHHALFEIHHLNILRILCCLLWRATLPFSPTPRLRVAKRKVASGALAATYAVAVSPACSLPEVPPRHVMPC